MYVINCLIWRHEQQYGTKEAKGLCLYQCVIDFSGARGDPLTGVLIVHLKPVFVLQLPINETSRFFIKWALMWEEVCLGIQWWKERHQTVQSSAVLIFSWSVTAISNNDCVACLSFICRKNIWIGADTFFSFSAIVQWGGEEREEHWFCEKHSWKLKLERIAEIRTKTFHFSFWHPAQKKLLMKNRSASENKMSQWNVLTPFHGFF